MPGTKSTPTAFLRVIFLRREAKVPQSDPWEKAAECSRAIERTRDLQTRQVLTDLQELWIGLANQSQITGASWVSEDIRTLAEIHAWILEPQSNVVALRRG
jgi:hypothetical protein